MTKAYSYVRMSSDVQLRGDSLRRQVERSREYANSHQLTLDDQFNLHDLGVSAFDGSNKVSGQLGLFLNAVRSDQIPKGSYLIIESLDRLSREDVTTALTTFLELLKAGIKVVTLSDNKYFDEKTDGMDLIYSLLIMTRAHEESALKSQRVSAAWKNKRANATSKKLTARCPAWLELSSDRTYFQIIQERASIVRDIFADCSNGMGSYAIARRLNQGKIPTFGTSDGWQISYVKKILDSRAVLGEFQPRTKSGRVRSECGDPILDYYPRIISNELFFTARAAINLRNNGGGGRKGPKISNLFSKLAVCGTCKSAMRYVDKGRKGGQRLVCDGFTRGRGCPAKHGWNYSEFESSFLFFVKEINLAEMFRDDKKHSRLAQINDKILAVQGELRGLEEKRDRTYNLLMESKFPDQTLRMKFTNLEAEIDRVQTLGQKATEERNSILAAHLDIDASQRNLVPLIESIQKKDASDSYKRRARIVSMLSSVIAQVWLFPAGILISAEKIAEMRQRIKAEEDIIQFDDFFRKSMNLGLAQPKQHRFFAAIFKDDTMRSVKPDPTDPTKFYYDIKNSLHDFEPIEKRTIHDGPFLDT